VIFDQAFMFSGAILICLKKMMSLVCRIAHRGREEERAPPWRALR